jgi:hypothetical protein
MFSTQTKLERIEDILAAWRPAELLSDQQADSRAIDAIDLVMKGSEDPALPRLIALAAARVIERQKA